MSLVHYYLLLFTSQIPLGRRFRALKLYFVLQMYGAAALRDGIRRHVALADRFAALVSEDKRFELPTPPSLSLVCFRLSDNAAAATAASSASGSGGAAGAAADALNMALLEAVNASGKAFLVHTKLSGRVVLRLAVGSPLTEETHIDQTWELLQAEADRLLGQY